MVTYSCAECLVAGLGPGRSESERIAKADHCGNDNDYRRWVTAFADFVRHFEGANGASFTVTLQFQFNTVANNTDFKSYAAEICVTLMPH